MLTGWQEINGVWIGCLVVCVVFVTYSLGVSRPLRFCACVELWESRRSGEQEAEAVPSLSELALLGGVGGRPCLDEREFVSLSVHASPL